MSGPLAGVRVLDLTHFVAGPWCTLLLADLGADVVKIEPPMQGEIGRSVGGVYAGTESAIFLGFNRGKRSVALDLKHDVGRRIGQAMARDADVVVHNFRPGTAERLGMDADTLRRDHSRLIHCAISAFGAAGPAADRPANDPIIQALSGAMRETGGEGKRPVRMGVSLPDLAGGVLAANAIAAALYRREFSGVGSAVELNLLEAELYAQVDRMTTAPREKSNPWASLPSPQGAYSCADAEALWINSDDLDAVARACGLSPPVQRSDIVTRMLSIKRSFALEALHEGGVTAVPICRLPDVLSDTSGRTIGIQHPVIGALAQVRTPVNASPPWPAATAPPPLLGQDTRAVLTKLGESDSDIDQWADQGILREKIPTALPNHPSRTHR
ncbi:CaiB/BaiF CoA transferase family protein [Arthrobacter pigmenti]